MVEEINDRIGFGEEIIHVIPLGWEIDRAVKPFERYKANRVYLLSVLKSERLESRMVERQRYFTGVVKEKLERRGIEVLVQNVDTFDLLDVMGTVSRIILDEKSKGNQVYVNVSGAGRLTSVGVALAAMAHGAKCYYVVADSYSKNPSEENEHGLSICEQLEMHPLPNFNLLLPKRDGIIVLVGLCRSGRPMKTKEILNLLKAEGVEGFAHDRGYEQLDRSEMINYLMKLNNRILKNLKEDGYITRERRGRHNLVKITQVGKYVAHISGLLGGDKHNDSV